MTFPVSEIFGPTIQGEGPHAGRSVQFLRLGGCNLACSWCDTPYTWDARRFNLRDELTQMTEEEITAKVIRGVPIVVTGGEPLLHQHNPRWGALLAGLHRECGEVHLETNGTITPDLVTKTWVTFAAISPKLPHSRQPVGVSSSLTLGWTLMAHNPGHRLGSGAVLKFVVRSAADVDLAVEYAKDAEWPLERVWVMPEGTTAEVLQARWPEVAERACHHGINASHRLHILAFGDTKGT